MIISFLYINIQALTTGYRPFQQYFFFFNFFFIKMRNSLTLDQICFNRGRQIQIFNLPFNKMEFFLYFFFNIFMR